MRLLRVVAHAELTAVCEWCLLHGAFPGHSGCCTHPISPPPGAPAADTPTMGPAFCLNTHDGETYMGGLEGTRSLRGTVQAWTASESLRHRTHIAGPRDHHLKHCGCVWWANGCAGCVSREQGRPRAHLPLCQVPLGLNQIRWVADGNCCRSVFSVRPKEH